MSDLALAALFPSLAAVVWRCIDLAGAYVARQKAVNIELAESRAATGFANEQVIKARQDMEALRQRLDQLEHFEEVARQKLAMKARVR